MYPVYPRWRGEHGFTSLNDFKFCGLSPLARGTQLDSALIITSSRFIPAGAGNTETAPAVVSCLPVYPRWRGEHFATRSKPPIRVGLSPLARGTLGQRPGWHPIFRFIPAGAGNTCRLTADAFALTVYPRWRGEHRFCRVYFKTGAGLSPLTRGTRNIVALKEILGRFIPAGAGNTLNFAGSCYPCPVYPRWRGEHRFLVAATRLKAGLSPLARGTRRLFNFKRLKPRFIPAGAGNTSTFPPL